MNPEKLAKIRKLAEDVRGDPATREIAQAALRRYAKPEPEPAFHDVPPPFAETRHPGMHTSPEYDRFKFMDLGSWKMTSSGNNPTYVIVRKGRSYRIVLFRHKKSPTFGWMRIDTMTDDTVFSGKFNTMGEAHSAAWTMLMAM